jgi:hypothetical protein
MRPNVDGLFRETGQSHYPFHYGEEAEQYTFYRIPKMLFDDPALKKLSTDAKLLYGLMLDRMSLSMKNGWLDECGRVFIYFSTEQIMRMIGCASAKCTKLLQELDDRNGVGLITRVKQGLGKPDVIYVHKCIAGLSKSKAQRFENQSSGDSESEDQNIRFPKSNITEKNNTDFSDTDRITSPNEGDDVNRRMKERSAYRSMVLENIEYDILLENRKYDREKILEIVELMVDTMCSTQKYITIGGDKKPTEVVKSQLSKLNGEHIQFVMDCMNKNTTEIRNIRKYLLAALYNAPMTIDSYYSALVNHDLYGG